MRFSPMENNDGRPLKSALFISSSLQKRERDWGKFTFAKTSGTVTIETGKIGQWLISVSPVTNPGTIAGHISTPVPFSFLK